MKGNNKSKKFFSILFNILSGIFILILFLTALSSLGVPKGLRLFSVMSGSMEPTILVGSIIFVMPKDEYIKGDIISFNKSSDDGSQVIITHRIESLITDNNQTSFVTKGDANNTIDMGELNKSQVIGKQVFGLPLLGYPISFAQTKVGVILFILVPSLVLVILEAFKIKDNLTKKTVASLILFIAVTSLVGVTFSSFTSQKTIENNSIAVGTWHTCNTTEKNPNNQEIGNTDNMFRMASPSGSTEFCKD